MMKILYKLILGFVLIAILVVFLGAIILSVSQEALKKSIGKTSILLASEILDEIDRDIDNKIEILQVYTNNPFFIETILRSNQEFESFDDPNRYIQAKDQAWVSFPKESVSPFMDEMMTNKLAQFLKEKQRFYQERYGYNIFGEIFVTNRYGANIAQTGKTTDYYQADEQWWQRAKEDGLYISDLEYDESADIYSLNISINIKDAEGRFLGVIKSVLNIQEVGEILNQAKEDSEYKSVALKVLNQRGQLIYDTTNTYQFLEDLSEKKFFKKMNKQRGYFHDSGELGIKGGVLAYAFSQGIKNYKGLSWFLTVEYDGKEIFEPVDQ